MATVASLNIRRGRISVEHPGRIQVLVNYKTGLDSCCIKPAVPALSHIVPSRGLSAKANGGSVWTFYVLELEVDFLSQKKTDVLACECSPPLEWGTVWSPR